jgi:hypothetical protein
LLPFAIVFEGYGRLVQGARKEFQRSIISIFKGLVDEAMALILVDMAFAFEVLHSTKALGRAAVC